jgi:hypothetical protein
MRYLARVMIAFSDDAKGPNVFDIWEGTLAVDSESPRQALAQAISNCRTVLDDPENWRALGYSTKPCLYAVKTIQTEVDLPGKKARCNRNCIMLMWIATFDEPQMAKIRAFEDVVVPYSAMHID